MTTLVPVPIKAELTEIEEFILDHVLDYGIIAGGFAAYLYNPEKKAEDIDLFVTDNIDSDTYDKLYHDLASKLGFLQKMKWRLQPQHPKLSNYNENVGVQGLRIFDYTKINKHGHYATIQLVSPVERGDPRHSTRESIVSAFDWNVCRATVLDKRTLLVDKHFIEDMETNRCTFRPYPPRRTLSDDYGWRLLKYVETKGYDMSFKDMLTVFGIVHDKKKFIEQIFCSGHQIRNNNLLNLGSFVKLMKNSDPTWQGQEF